MKIYIKRNEKKPDHVCIMLTTYISFDGIKPYDMNELEWGVIKSYVEKIKLENLNVTLILRRKSAGLTYIL